MTTPPLPKRLFAVVDPGGRVGERSTGLDKAIPATFFGALFGGAALLCVGSIMFSALLTHGPGAFAFGPERRPALTQTLIAHAADRSVALADLGLVAPRIIVDEDSLFGAEGTGCVWRPKEFKGVLWIVTNRHVLGLADSRPRSTMPRVEVEFHNGTRASPRRIGLVTDVDLAVLEIPDAGLELGTDYQELAPALDSDWHALQPSREIAMVGTMLGLKQSRSFGHIGEKREQELDLFTPLARYIQIDGTVLPGNSGGPLLLKEDGEWIWIGVNTLTYEGRVGFAIHTSELFRHPIEWFGAE